jgi:hypothetical protein
VSGSASARRRPAAVAAAALAILAAAGLAAAAVPAQPAAAQPSAGAAAGAWLYSARPGDTIWDLSRRYLVDWRRWPELQALNRVADPRRIPPGSILRIPLDWLRPAGAEAVVDAVRPPAELRGGGALAEGRALGPGDAVAPGDVVATGPGGSVALRLADGSRILVAGETTLAIERLLRFEGTPLADSLLRLERGRVEPEGVASGSRLSILSPPATTSVRGTGFRLALEEDGRRLDAEVLEGRVRVAAGAAAAAAAPAGRAATAALVGAGFGTSTALGRPPEAPRRLLPAPDVAAAPATADRLPLALEAAPVPGAAAYRFQLAPDARFGALVRDELVEAPPAGGAPRLRVAPDPPDGAYAWRVRAVDAGGLEGLDSAPRALVLDARPEPPAPLLPRRAGKVREPLPRFAWAAPVDAAGYRFRLAPAAAPDRPLVDRDDVAGAEFRPEAPLPVGEYVWQVATRAADGEVGPLGDPQPFTRADPPPAPEPEVGEASSDALVVRLPRASAAEGTRYQVQLAPDPAFGEPALDRVLDEPELRVAHLRPGRYYLRARVVEADGYEGAFGPAQRIDVKPARWWPLVVVPLALVLLAL